jgi:signal peptidase I
VATAKKEKSSTNSLIEFFVIIAVALGLALVIQAVLVKPFRIPSGSMIPTLEIKQRVLVDRVTGHFSDPDRGDILVFKPPAGAETDECGIPSEPADGHPCAQPTRGESSQNFIKRVVGLPGDRIKVISNRVYINGRRQNEPFIRKGTPCDRLCDLPQEITVPAGHLFMMGDNRGESDDSRAWGPVPEGSIIGHAFFTYWPPKRIGTL